MSRQARDFQSSTIREGVRVQELLTVRRVPMYLVLLTFLLDLIFSVSNNGWLYGLPFFRDLMGNQSVIEPDLLANVLILLLELIVILGVIRVRPNQIRTDRWQTGHGLVFALACLDLLLIAYPFFAFTTNQPPKLETYITTFWIGQFLTFTLGVALSEEVLYRGFFLGQFYQHIELENNDNRLGLALLTSQALFAIIHIPARVMTWGTQPDRLPLELFSLFGMGLAYAFIYLRTRSLVAAIVAHALVDLIVSLPGSPVLPKLLIFAALGLVTMAWPWLANPRAPLFRKTFAGKVEIR
jgi:membrane protease YdiL (CAAX protease family)